MVDPLRQQPKGPSQQLLDDWVAKLVRRHELAMDIPQCWRQHPGLADELAVLWAEEQAASANKQMVSSNWFRQLRELVRWTAERPAGACARRERHEKPLQWPTADGPASAGG